MPANPSGKRTARALDFDLRVEFATGGVGATGDKTVSGLLQGDILTAVIHRNDSGTDTIVTDEFSITADATINNDGGSTFVSGQFEVWYKALTSR